MDTLNDRIKEQIKPVTDDPAFANVSVSNQALGNLKLPEPVDVVWTSQNYHDFKNPGMFFADTVAMDKAVFAALKPGGLYIIIDHVAAAGSGTRDTGTLHRIDPETVKAEVLGAGFVLEGESKDLANPDPHTARACRRQGGIGDKSDEFFSNSASRAEARPVPTTPDRAGTPQDFPPPARGGRAAEADRVGVHFMPVA